MKSNFRRNLLIGFSASLIVLLISSAASFISITNLLNSADLVTHTNEVIVELTNIRTALVDAETGQRGYLLVGEKEFLNPYIDARERALTAIERAKELTFDNPIQKDDLNKVEKLVAERFKYLEVGIERKDSGATVDVRHLEEGRRIMQEVRSTLRLMRSRESKLLADRTETMNKFAGYTPPLIISAAMIALLITVSFYVRVRNDFEERARLQQELEAKDQEITMRINIIEGIADKIAQGKYEIRVNDQQSDSLGKVADALNRMAESLEYSFGLLSDKEWLQTGIAKLNDLIIGEKTVDVLSSEVVEFMSGYTNSHAGAFYVLEGDSLQFTGGYAYIPPDHRKSLSAYEGLIGQAMVGRKLIELSELRPEDIQVSFATGQVKPRSVVTFPITDGTLVKGVAELASLNGFSERDKEFLLACSQNIGIAISTAQNRRRLQELLEETQSQAEELKTQHSELENLNSELEVQAEKLQASEEELKVQQEELKQANQELEERSRLLEERNQIISERNIEIQTKADELAQTTKYKSEFLANMSHELRTPLNSILLLSRLMAENPQKNLVPEQVEYARVIQSSGHGLLALIDEILDLSKIEAGKMALEYQSVSLNEIVDNMTSLFNPVAGEKKIEFRTFVDPELPAIIQTDKLRLEQVLRNLVSNAIKFTGKGYVSLSLKQDPTSKDFVLIAVEDTGIGIAKEKQQLVFEAFQQADGSTRRKFGGTGLGLSISRELVKLLGGSIAVESEVDAGSTFTVRLPVAPGIKIPVQPQQQPKTIVEPVVKESSSNLEKRKYISTVVPENVPDDRQLIHEGDRSILIIEDDVPFAKSLLEFTRKRGYKGIVSVRGDEGVELAKAFKPQGILLDIQLPVKSGWEVMEELKSNAETRHIPVHIMSSHEVKSESLQKGAVDFINKPFAFEQVSNVFQKIEYVLTHHPKKVLIVEENAKHAKALAYFLETFDVNIDIKNEVDGAISALKSADVDCVILDMGVPDQKGYDTLEAVKRTPGLEGLPIIIFTGKSLSQNEELKIKQYADSIVVKTAHSYKRIIDEVSLFLHLMEEKTGEKARPHFGKLGAMDEVLKGKKVLIADDDLRNVFSLTKALEKYEMKVVPAVDGKEALTKLQENPDVDIILMDIMMPEMDGYEATAAIRRNPRFRNLPIIAVTAKAMTGDRIKCINAGASDYITKPVDVDQLFSLLRVWLYERA